MNWEKRRAHAAALAACAGLLAAIGCGDGGIPRYDVSGAVTLNGQPAASGVITFSPDRAQGNTGPTGYAKIENGKYRTITDRGVIGGPHSVVIELYDGVPNPPNYPNGQRVLDDAHCVEVDFPKANTEMDFDVPKG